MLLALLPSDSAEAPLAWLAVTLVLAILVALLLGVLIGVIVRPDRPAVAPRRRGRAAGPDPVAAAAGSDRGPAGGRGHHRVGGMAGAVADRPATGDPGRRRLVAGGDRVRGGGPDAGQIPHRHGRQPACPAGPHPVSLLRRLTVAAIVTLVIAAMLLTLPGATGGGRDHPGVRRGHRHRRRPGGPVARCPTCSPACNWRSPTPSGSMTWSWWRPSGGGSRRSP